MDDLIRTRLSGHDDLIKAIESAIVVVASFKQINYFFVLFLANDVTRLLLRSFLNKSNAFRLFHDITTIFQYVYTWNKKINNNLNSSIFVCCSSTDCHIVRP